MLIVQADTLRCVCCIRSVVPVRASEFRMQMHPANEDAL